MEPRLGEDLRANSCGGQRKRGLGGGVVFSDEVRRCPAGCSSARLSSRTPQGDARLGSCPVELDVGRDGCGEEKGSGSTPPPQKVEVEQGGDEGEVLRGMQI